MAFNLIIGLAHNLIWYIWAIVVYRRERAGLVVPRHAAKQALVLTLFAVLTLLELLDFEPWHRAIDAHALWHLSTVPVIGLFYEFHSKDALYLEQVHLEGRAGKQH